ncbi:MAG: hypothetical protein ABI333_15465 [bacterium]
MKTTIITIAIAITFAASSIVSSEAEARTRNSSNSSARSQRQPARTTRTPARTTRTPARTVRQPVKHVRQPVRHVRQPVRHVRQPVRHVPTLVRRHYQPVYVPVVAVNTVTLTNDHGYAISVELRAGNSAFCSANPSQGSVFLGAGDSTSVTTTAAYVCYRRLATNDTAGSGWFRALVNARYMSLLF